MKKVLIVLILFGLMHGVAFSDLLQVPIDCWPIQLQEGFKKSGRKLDLSPNERTKDSWGYLVNLGSKFELYTYQSATKEDFEFIQKLVWKIIEDMKNE